MVWEEATGTTQNTADLYYSWRDPGTGTWSAAAYAAAIPATDTSRFTGATDDFYSRVQVDGAGNLHIVYAEKQSSPAATSAYYIVGKSLKTAPSWTTPLRIDPSTTYLYAVDDVRLYVYDSDPSLPAYSAVGYVLWTGTAANTINISRIGFAGGATTLVDAAPVANPQSMVAGPVSIVPQDATHLYMVYATKNTTAGNQFYGASLTLGGGTPTWQATATQLVGDFALDCAQSGCPGGSAVRDGSGATWVAADWDSTGHKIQVTRYNGTASSTVFDSGARSGRQPVIVYDSSTASLITVYDICTYVNVTTCTSSDLAYRKYSAGAWGSAITVSPTTGEQKDPAAIYSGGQLYLAWVGTGQGITGDQIYFQVITSP
jgi:hypothetical protein